MYLERLTYASVTQSNLAFSALCVQQVHAGLIVGHIVYELPGISEQILSFLRYDIGASITIVHFDKLYNTPVPGIG